MRVQERGFSLIEAMIAVVVLGIVALGMSEFFINMTREQKRLSTLFQLQQIQKNISTLVSTDGVWAEIVNRNETLKCLRAGATTPCANGASGSVSLFTAGGAAFFDPATQGFGLDGEVCQQSSPLCMIRLNLKVDFTCPGSPPSATCATPDQVVFRGMMEPFNIEPGRPLQFNASNYAMNVRKDNVLAAGGGGGGGQIVEFTCSALITDFGYNFTNPLCQRTDSSGTLKGVNSCDPQLCPSGYSQVGQLFSRTATSIGNGYYQGSIYGNCVRLCAKN